MSVEDAIVLADHDRGSRSRNRRLMASLEYIEEIYEETEEQRQAAIGKIIGELEIEDGRRAVRASASR